MTLKDSGSTKPDERKSSKPKRLRSGLEETATYGARRNTVGSPSSSPNAVWGDAPVAKSFVEISRYGKSRECKIYELHCWFFDFQ